MNSLNDRLDKFRDENGVTTKGALSLAVQFSRMVKNRQFPLNVTDFQTDSKGQVAGIGGANLKRILKEHGILRRLSSEGGRTSRGSMGLMEKYVAFLNDWAETDTVDMDAVEAYWADQVRDYFNRMPFELMSDTSKTIGACFDDLFEQARKRQAETPGMQYLGTVLQHLVAAKLMLIMPEGSFEVHGAAVADAPTGRSGDFVLNNTIIHCTTMPGELLMSKCMKNIESGCHPVIITIFDRVSVANVLVEEAGLSGRVEVWDVQQFLSSNVFEHSLFDTERRDATIADIVDNYNKIIDTAETDPSLRIEFLHR